MIKKQIKIVNFLQLNDEKFEQIRTYRNQKFIRAVSLNEDKITKEQHQTYKKLLLQKKDFFAYLLLCDEKDYGVISLTKNEDSFDIGTYLVDELYKYEGGGLACHFCVLFICEKLNIKIVSYKIKSHNTRIFRNGNLGEVLQSGFENDLISGKVLLDDFYGQKNMSLKQRKLFDRVYEIVEFKN